MDKKLKMLTDKDLMTFLVSIGFEIESIKKDKIHNRSLVYFEQSEQLENAILNYANKAITVNIADYQAAERRIKTLLCIQKVS